MILTFGIPASLRTTSVGFEWFTVHRTFQYQCGASIARYLDISIKDAHRT
jgi:hypothetical protein